MSSDVLYLYVLLVVLVTADDDPKSFLGSKNNFMKTYKENRLKSPYTVHNHRQQIVGGEKVQSITQFPYMAYVYILTKESQEYKCGGTILNKKYILTAGHCVRDCDYVDEANVVKGAHVKTWCKKFNAQDYNIHVGRIIPDLTKPHYVKQYFIHPKQKEYDFENQCRLNYDIAILELKKPLKFNKRISSVRLPSSVVLNPRHRFNLRRTGCKILGWGFTEIDKGDEIDFLTERLKVASVKAISNEQCIKELKKSGRQSIYQDLGLCRASHFCTIDPKGSNGFCGGDSGGPLICDGLQVGIISMGVDQCAGPHIAHIYTRVDINVKWINKIIWR